MAPNITEHQIKLITERARRYHMRKGLPVVIIGYNPVGEGDRWLGRIDFREEPPPIAWEIDTTPGRETIRDIPIKPLNDKTPAKK